MIFAFSSFAKTTLTSKTSWIGKTIIFQALMNISNFIINLTYSSNRKLDFKSFCDTLNPIISNMSESTIKKPGKSYKAFSEKIKEATIKFY